MYNNAAFIHDDIVVDIGIIVKPILSKKEMLMIIFIKTDINEK